MNTAEMIAGLREYVGALKEYVEALKNRESVNANLQALFKANERQIGALDWLDNHASAIADELAMLAEEVKHLKPLAEEIVAENARLRAEVERLKGLKLFKACQSLLRLWDDNHPDDPCGCLGASEDCPHPPPCELCVARDIVASALDAKGGG